MKEPTEIVNPLKFTQWFLLVVSARKTDKALEEVLSQCFPKNLKPCNSKSSVEATIIH